MYANVRVLGALHVVFGALGTIGGVIALMFFGGLAGLVGMTEQSHDARIAVPILGAIGGIIFIIALVLSLPSLVAGLGLLRFQPWARILTIILSVLHLLNIPLGTALGFYGLWVLLSSEGQRLFERPPGPAVRA